MFNLKKTAVSAVSLMTAMTLGTGLLTANAAGAPLSSEAAVYELKSYLTAQITEFPAGEYDRSVYYEQEGNDQLDVVDLTLLKRLMFEPESSETSEPETSESVTSGSETSEPETSESETSESETSEPKIPDSETPFAKHGKLSVNGPDLVDKNGEKYQLYGMSTHGIAWYPGYVSQDTFRTLRDDWNTNCVRIAMYTSETNGYGIATEYKREELKNLVKNGVDYATQLGMYVIIDWHILNENMGQSNNGDPHKYKAESIAFFDELSELYKDRDNVLYEICNEPNGSAINWDTVKSYANEVIPVIRENDSDAIVLVGSPTWSQDIDKAQQSPLQFDNIMYTLHFYAGTHGDYLRNRLESCVSSGLPVFVSEFAICDSSGNGVNDTASGQQWMDLMNKYNVSYMAWNLGNKNESSCAFKSAVYSDWSDDVMSEWGLWIREQFRSEQNQ